MPTPTLVAMLDARPSRPFWGKTWVQTSFAAHVPGYAGSDRGGAASGTIEGWSVGGCLGAETLVQSRPMARGSNVDPVDDFLRAEATCTLGLFLSSQREPVRPFDGPRTGRFRRWMAAASAPPLPEAHRAEILSALPPFLAREASGQPDVQLLLLSVLASLFGNNGFRRTFATAEEIGTVLGELDTRLGEGPRALFVSDGRTLGVAHKGGCLWSTHPPEDLWPRAALQHRTQPNLPSSLMFWTPGVPDAPRPDAERVAEGVLTADARDPGPLCRVR